MHVMITRETDGQNFYGPISTAVVVLQVFQRCKHLQQGIDCQHSKVTCACSEFKKHASTHSSTSKYDLIGTALCMLMYMVIHCTSVSVASRRQDDAPQVFMASIWNAGHPIAHDHTQPQLHLTVHHAHIIAHDQPKRGSGVISDSTHVCSVAFYQASKRLNCSAAVQCVCHPQSRLRTVVCQNAHKRCCYTTRAPVHRPPPLLVQSNAGVRRCQL